MVQVFLEDGPTLDFCLHSLDLSGDARVEEVGPYWRVSLPFTGDEQDLMDELNVHGIHYHYER